MDYCSIVIKFLVKHSYTIQSLRNGWRDQQEPRTGVRGVILSFSLWHASKPAREFILKALFCAPFSCWFLLGLVLLINYLIVSIGFLLQKKPGDSRQIRVSGYSWTGRTRDQPKRPVMYSSVRFCLGV